jgi:hypothetical protein
MKTSRRDVANMLARRQGVPTTQAGIDAMHATIVSRLNAALPARATAPLKSSADRGGAHFAGEQRQADPGRS